MVIRQNLPGNFNHLQIDVFPVVHNMYTRFSDHRRVRHKGLSFLPKFDVDEKIESGLNLVRCSGKYPWLAAAHEHFWVTPIASPKIGQQISFCALSHLWSASTYLTLAGNTNVTRKHHAQTGKSPEYSDGVLKKKMLKPVCHGFDLGMQKTLVESLFLRLAGALASVSIWGLPKNAH